MERQEREKSAAQEAQEGREWEESRDRPHIETFTPAEARREIDETYRLARDSSPRASLPRFPAEDYEPSRPASASLVLVAATLVLVALALAVLLLR